MRASWRMPGSWITRGNLRLASGLVLLTFVVCHLTAHSFLIISIDRADAALKTLMAPWRTDAGSLILGGALTIHYANALWSIYLRRSLRLTRWEWSQLLLGLCIPPLLTLHVIATRIAEEAFGTLSGYKSVLLAQWVVMPWWGVAQTTALLTVWLHASIGIHFWLRVKRWYPDWQPVFAAVALLLPTLALSGYVTAGNQVAREAQNPQTAQALLNDTYLTEDALAGITRIATTVWAVELGLVLLPFAARLVRGFAYRRRRPRLIHASGRTMPMLPGATVLETLRVNRVPHASVCGGRARCTTCRILVSRGLDALPAPSGPEAAALARIAAMAGVRLACQIRPRADIAVTPLLSADATAADGYLRGGLEGTERLVAVLFVDLRGYTGLGEAKLPYDVLFILNLFFHEMVKALNASDGHYSQFTGDGLMALYGLDAENPAIGARDALRGAREMLVRLDALNRQLAGELASPLRIGIGIHFSEAIVGRMGPPRSRTISAIGDTVNTAARLEGLTKDYDCPIILSRRAALAAGLDLTGHTLHEIALRGRAEPVQFYALAAAPDLPG
ncbi:MAG: adenylate/guanylate cyclase domain-containing protein [Xanthobacteraceae bacterium]